MNFLEGAGLELGLGIAVGMLAGTTGTRGSARGRMTLLAAVIGLGLGALLSGAAELNVIAGAFFCLLGAVTACIVVSDVVSGASRRKEGGGTAALGFLISLAALVVVAVAILLPPATVVILAALIWLGLARHRRAQRKHAGLRVLR